MKTIITILLVLIIGGIGYAGWYFSEQVINIKVKNSDSIMKREIEENCIKEGYLDEIKNKADELKIKSNYGYDIEGWILNNKSDKTIIISHGVTVSRLTSLKYVEMFKKRNWNVVLFDQRSHGSSGGENVSYGYFEKEDLKKVVDFTKDKFGEDTTIGIHGESMGAAIMLEYAGKYDEADFYISDCGYSSLKDQLAYRLKVEYNIPEFPLIDVSNLFVKLRAGFSIYDVEPIKAVEKIKSPVMFVHGKEDRYILPDMAVEMYEKKIGAKKLILFDEGRHARSYTKNKKEYEKEIFDFLNENNIN